MFYTIVISLLALLSFVLYLAKPFNVFCPIKIYRRYPKITTEMAAPIVLFQFRKGVNPRSKDILYDAMEKGGYVPAESSDFMILRTELSLPPGMSIHSEIEPDVFAVIYASHRREDHITRLAENLSFAQHDLYAAIPSEFAHLRKVTPSRQSLSRVA